MQKKKLDRSCPVESSTSIFRIPLLTSFTQLKLQDEGEDIWWYIYIYMRIQRSSSHDPRISQGPSGDIPAVSCSIFESPLTGTGYAKSRHVDLFGNHGTFSHVSHFLHRALYLYCTAVRHLIPFRRFGTSDANSTCIPRLHQHLLKLVHGRTKLY